MFGLPTHSRGLLVASLLDATGSGLFLSGSAVYFTRSVGLSASEVGIGLTVAGVCGVLALTPIGVLADRVGPRPVSVLLHIWQALGFLGYAFVHDLAGFLVVACVLGIPAQAVQPVAQVLVEQHAGPDVRVRTMATFRALYNAGFAIGAVLTTVIVAIGTREAYQVIVLGDAASFLLAGLLVARVPLPHARLRGPRPAGRLASLRNVRFLAVAGVNAVMVLHMSLLSVGIPLWATLHTAAPLWVVGPILLINTVLAVTLQVRVSRGVETVSGGSRALMTAGVFLAACCLLLSVAGAVGAVGAVAVVVLATVALTAGELYQSAAGWSLSYGLAPQERQGEYIAVFGLGVGGQYTVGPALLTVGVIAAGPAGWIALAVVFLVAAGLVRPAVRAAQH